MTTASLLSLLDDFFKEQVALPRRQAFLDNGTVFFTLECKNYAEATPNTVSDPIGLKIKIYSAKP